MLALCDQCEKPDVLCVCSEIQPQPTQTHILILQHPQEPDKLLGSAKLAHLCLPNSTLRVGLSWPNLQKALGKEAIPARWGALYLGSGLKKADAHSKTIHLTDRKGEPLSPSAQTSVEGVIVLDGTWSQAKTLWWRNPWLLKLKRIILTPTQKSLYRELRREPRRECLSTIESIAECLEGLGEEKSVGIELKNRFDSLLKKYRTQGPMAPKPKSQDA